MQPVDSVESSIFDKQLFRASEKGAGIEVSVEHPVKTELNMHSYGVNSPSSRFSSCFGKSLNHWALMIVSGLLLLVGISSASLLGRLYFVHGGSHRWLYTWIQSIGWPINLPPLLVYYWRFSVRPTPLKPKLLAIYVGMGCLTAFDNLLYSWGISYLPVSTNSLLCASQLAFNALFSYAIVGQKITPYVTNSVFTISVGAILLGISASSDRPTGTTEKQYISGFVVTIAAAAIYSLLLTLMELIYRRVVGKNSFVVVMEAQTAISVIATVVSMTGMWIDMKDLAAVQEEATSFNLGPAVYSMTLVGSAIGWQLFFLGSAGIIFLASSLMSCVFMTAVLPILPILAVIFFHDEFSSLKGVAMLLSMWGFISYIYGGYVASKSRKAAQDVETGDLQIQTF